MATYPSRRRLGVRKVAVREVEHLRVHYDPTLYMYGPNRGGIWNFGDGELAVAYLAGPVDYQVAAGAAPHRPARLPDHRARGQGRRRAAQSLLRLRADLAR